MIKQKVRIKNETGLHARPASQLVKVAGKYEADFYIHLSGYRINGKSILGVMTLAAGQGAELELEVDGPDEKEALKNIVALIENEFEIA